MFLLLSKNYNRLMNKATTDYTLKTKLNFLKIIN